MLADGRRQFVAIEAELVRRMRKTGDEGAGADALHGRLVISRRIREAAVIEDVVEVEVFGVDLQSVEIGREIDAVLQREAV